MSRIKNVETKFVNGGMRLMLLQAHFCKNCYRWNLNYMRVAQVLIYPLSCRKIDLES